MANQVINFSVTGVSNTETFYSPLAGLFTLQGHIDVPNGSGGSATSSTVVATIKQNGTTIATTTAGADGFSIPVFAAAGDTFTVTLTSSTASDEVVNAVRCTGSMG